MMATSGAPAVPPVVVREWYQLEGSQEPAARLGAGPVNIISYLPQVEDYNDYRSAMQEAWDEGYNSGGTRGIRLSNIEHRTRFQTGWASGGRIYANEMGSRFIEWWDEQVDYYQRSAEIATRNAQESHWALHNWFAAHAVPIPPPPDMTIQVGALQSSLNAATAARDAAEAAIRRRERSQQQAAMDYAQQVQRDLDALQDKVNNRFKQNPMAAPYMIQRSDKWIDVRLREMRIFMSAFWLDSQSPTKGAYPSSQITESIYTRINKKIYHARNQQINSRLHGGDLRTDCAIGVNPNAIKHRHGKHWPEVFRTSVQYMYGDLPPRFFNPVLAATDHERYGERSWFGRLDGHVRFIDKYVSARGQELDVKKTIKYQHPNVATSQFFDRIELCEQKFRPYMAQFGELCEFVSKQNFLQEEAPADTAVINGKLDELDKGRFLVFDQIKNWVNLTDRGEWFSERAWEHLRLVNQLDAWPVCDFYQDPDPQPGPGQSASQPLQNPPPPYKQGQSYRVRYT
ncbi:hypothetical protein QBC43DRAFT_351761 [Cladorrhinum sp. PSN259]|nr:hypothetical protein QBC43DRAFT_351761 [Cladorrhinum sp. PSN259]